MYESVGGSVSLRCSGSKACQASLTGAGREWTVGLGSSWPTMSKYGQSKKRSSELNASGSSNAKNTRSFLRQEAIRGTYSVDSSKQRVNTYTGTSNSTGTNDKSNGKDLD
ncbi:conserved hypothetical protein [Trichinella spiralis]|uniref:Uncharacterized protein n=1 Tax=Trichinella spiralis TaxID=6334 RepID=E5S7D4_TRISP|nr:conserved hypothetical protein [Trichinella spiralis]KRY39136.1 hypothetical protein T01_14799 [Trichinella spiralis]